MRKIDSLFEEYGQSHQNKLNKRIHWICVPAIFWSLVGILYSIPTPSIGNSTELLQPLNWAILALILVLVYYIRLSPALAIGMLVFSLLCLKSAEQLINLFPFALWKFASAIFVLAWAGQFYGHKVEGKKPSFLKDLQFLLIGPAWLLHFIYIKLGLKY